MKKSRILQSLLLLLAGCLLAGGVFCLLIRFDNKYTARAPFSQEGGTRIDTASLSGGEVVSLTDGWELYPDRLLSPAELAAGDYAAFPLAIGQYPNFSAFHENGSPYGTATYRLRLQGGEQPAVRTVLLHEIFSAFQVYVNGEAIGGRGGLFPYSPRVQDFAFSFLLEGEAELVIWVENQAHYYSGITYPPLLGSAQAIAGVLSSRMIFYGFLCFSSLAVALFSSAVWIGKRNRLLLWFGILALCFSIQVCYPFARLAGAPPIRFLYALEDAASAGVIFCACQLTCILSGFSGRRWAALTSRLLLGMCVVCAVVPAVVLPLAPAFTAVYGPFISYYKLLAAPLLIALAFCGGIHGRAHLRWLLAGFGAYGTSLLANVLLLNLYEPIRTGWPNEYGSFFLVLCFAAVMVRQNLELVRENSRLTVHLREEVEKKTNEINSLVTERQGLLSEFLHDLKSPMASVLGYIQLIQKNNIQLDRKTREQLNVIREKCDDMSGRMTLMQEFTAQESMSFEIESVQLNGLLREFHRLNQPDVEVSGPDFLLRLPDHACVVRGSAGQLSRALQNLVYNAANFTPPGGTIILSLEAENDAACIRVRDTGCGIPEEALPKVFNRFFTSRAYEGGRGLGLYIVKTIVSEHGGTIAVRSKPGKGTEFTIRLPLSEPAG